MSKLKKVLFGDFDKPKAEPVAPLPDPEAERGESRRRIRATGKRTHVLSDGLGG